jgi:hypothetical protein
MAFSVKIRGIPIKDDQPLWSVDNVIWWDIPLLMQNYPGREIEDQNLYLDYVIVLTPDEAVLWNERFREDCQKKGLLQHEDGIKQIKELGDKLETSKNTLRWILIERYEWESGM